MSPSWRAVPPDSGVVVIVGADEPDPTAEEMAQMGAALTRAGLDGLARWSPAVDALVRVGGDGRVAEHVDRSDHGRLGLPQVLLEAAWNRFLVTHPRGTDAPPAMALSRLGGRIGTFAEDELGGS